MDDQTRLVAELQAKLSELDSKVNSYCQDMKVEFRRYATELLEDVSPEVKDAVGRTIAESIPSYPSLFASYATHSDGPESPRSPRPDVRIAWSQRRSSPPPILPHTSGPKDGPRSPHERDNDFLGFITPSYLPMLDGSARQEQSPPLSPPLNSPQPSMRSATPRSGDDSPTPIIELSQNIVRPTSLKRHHTDNTVSSTDSTGSESRIRRSALRRSSSSAKGSPRRVRFRVEGAGEVLPTASPQGSQDALSKLPKDASAVTTGDDSPLEAAGTSLLDVEGEEDYLPLPKKVSSTEALRALSRNPLDRGTIWHVVNADPEDANTLNGIEGNSGSHSASSSTTEMAGGSKETLKGFHFDSSRQTAKQERPSPRVEEIDGDEDEESDEDFLSMGSKAAKKSPSPASPSPLEEVEADPAQAQAKARSLGSLAKEKASVETDATENAVEEEEPFAFDGADLGIASNEKADAAPPAPLAEESSGDDDEEPEELTIKSKKITLPVRPAVQMPTPPAVSTPTSKHMTETSIGSYKGTPLRMDPIHNPKLNDELAQMGAVNTFMGSFHDWDGADSSNPSSFRASLMRYQADGAGVAAPFPGTPGSLSERLMLEEAMGSVGDKELEERLQRPPRNI
jgi:hypothetical protein